MAKAGAQHELVGVIVDRYPEVVYGIAAVLGLEFPEHDLVTAAPNGHQVRKKNPIHTDATVRMVEEALASELAMARMAQLPSVQKMLAQARAAAQEKAEAAAARAQQDARAAEERARAAEEKNREDVARAKLEMAAGSLREYFVAKGEALTVSALKRISACTDLEVLRSWQMRAYRGETAAEIFSGDENGEDPAAST